MKKSWLALILAVGMSLGLAACGGGGSSQATGGTSEAASSASTEEAGDSSEADASSASESESVSSSESSESADSETDIMYKKSDIEAAADGLGDWEAPYLEQMAVKGDESFTWGLIVLGYEDTFNSKLRNTMAYYCELNFPNVKLLQADGEMDPNIQLQHAENYIAQGVDCIILIPSDADGCVGIVDTCRENNMPLVTMTGVVHSDLFNNGVGFVGSDNYESGKLEAEWILDNVDDTETVKMCYQRGTEGYDHTEQRQAGVFETLDNAGFNYELVSTQIGDYMRDKAMNNAEDWITAYGDEITVIPCANDEMAMGTLNAYRAADMADNVKILGIDANQDAIQEVANGSLACTIMQNGLGQVKWAAASAYDACVNKTIDTKGVNVPFERIDSTNVDQYLQ